MFNIINRVKELHCRVRFMLIDIISSALLKLISYSTTMQIKLLFLTTKKKFKFLMVFFFANLLNDLYQ